LPLRTPGDGRAFRFQLTDHVVCACLQGVRNRKADRLRGPEVDVKLDD
jgi:hypothetical protein